MIDVSCSQPFPLKREATARQIFETVRRSVRDETHEELDTVKAIMGTGIRAQLGSLFVGRLFWHILQLDMYTDVDRQEPMSNTKRASAITDNIGPIRAHGSPLR